MKLRKYVTVLSAAACIAGGAYLGSIDISRHATNAYGDTTAETAKPAAQPQPEATAPLADLSRAFRAVHESLKDAVVNINTVQKVAAAPAPKIPDELRRMLPPGFEMPDEPEQGGRLEGTGSGVIVSPDGYVLTNNHVVENAETITVRLDDERELPAKVIGRDPKSDLAVVKIDGKNLTYAKLGDSDDMQVGDWVLAFGSPFGFEQTMTQGIISAKGRSHVDIIASHNPTLQGMTYENFLQTDAAINPGNSGGPLVNLKGEVIGIDTAIASRTGAYSGIGFAIPSNDARYVMESLIKNGKMVRGYLGVSIQDILEPRVRDLAKTFGYTGNTGILVAEPPRPDTPASKAGIEKGDIITAMDGKKVQTIGQLRNTVARTAPGTKILLSVFRNGKDIEVPLEVGTQPESIAAATPGGDAESNPGAAPMKSDELGITVSDLTPDLAAQLHAKGEKGVVVTKVDPEGIAGMGGLAPGDIILDVQGKTVSSVDDFKAGLKVHKLSDGIRLSVRSVDGSEHFVLLEKSGQ